MINVYTGEELSLIRESARLVAKTLIFIESQVKPGVSTLFLDKIAEDFIRSNNAIPAFLGYGGSRNPYPATLCVSINEEVVHGIPGGRYLKDGDIVGIDCGTILNGFYGDHAKTFLVGNVSESCKKLVEITRQSLDIGIEQAIEGNHVNDIGSAIQAFIESNGYSIVRDLVGHGVGRKLHEDPPVPNYGKKGTGAVLQAGMVLAIEPMVNMGSWRVKVLRDGWTIVTADKKNSAHFEHTVLVGKDKAEILSQA
ncbi:MAG: type I methionyl aminopeptidase [Bacteroidetes bacterium]|nr:type I methionyl aminopeptidase [Bacteroidota bacterium]